MFTLQELQMLTHENSAAVRYLWEVDDILQHKSSLSDAQVGTVLDRHQRILNHLLSDWGRLLENMSNERRRANHHAHR